MSALPDRPAPQPDILLISGFARSGTTILEILLASSPKAFGAGELTHIFRDGFLSDGLCACGVRFSECPVWSRIAARLAWSRADHDRALRLFRRIEAHGRFPLLATGMADTKDLKVYLSINTDLFQAIADVTNCTTVIDSSKYAGRALALAEAFSERVRVLAVTRSPAGLMSSFRKPRSDEQKQKSPLATALYHGYVLTCLRYLKRRLGSRVLDVDYEELVADPTGTLRRIESWSGNDLTGALERLHNNEAFKVGHIVTGNRIRYRGEVRFAPQAGKPELRELTSRAAVRVMEAYERLLTR